MIPESRDGFARVALALLLAAVVCACGGQGAPPARGEQPQPAAVQPGLGRARNVVVVSLDTLRADRLEVYGGPRKLAPNLSALASRSVVFDSAQAQSSQTAPSHASLFTSEYGGVHRIRNVHGAVATMPTLPGGLVTLAELLKSAGYETGAFVSGGNLTRGMGLSRGFDHWDEKNEDIGERARRLLAWIDEPNRGPFFAFLHSYQVHAPYVPPASLGRLYTDPAYAGPLRARYERYLTLGPSEAWAGGVGADYWEGMLDFTDEDVRFLSDLYDAEIAYTDAALRPFLEALLIGPRAADTALIILSDHGEEFREHGKFQHDQVFEELLRVPLMVRLPARLERAGWKGRVTSPVELVDVAPTVAELLNVDVSSAGWAGRSLVGLLDGATRTSALRADRARHSLLTLDPGPKTFRSITWRGWKYIHGHQEDLDVTWELLFDLTSDPGERRNLFGSEDAGAVNMLASLKRLMAAHAADEARRAEQAGVAGTAEIDEEQRKLLEQLGYVK